MCYLHRQTEEEGEQVHDGQAREKLFLQEHVGVVHLSVLWCGVVMVRLLDLVVHHHHVDHHAHNWDTEHQADEERPPPSRRKQHITNGTGLLMNIRFI